MDFMEVRKLLEPAFAKVKPDCKYVMVSEVQLDLFLEGNHQELTNFGHSIEEAKEYRCWQTLNMFEASISIAFTEDPTLELSDVTLRIDAHGNLALLVRGEPIKHVIHMPISCTEDELAKITKADKDE